MCKSWTCKYLCGCIHEEWRLPCSIIPQNPNLTPTPTPQCYQHTIHEVHDVLTMCEECWGKLDARIRRSGLKKVLQSTETFPLAAYLGMLILSVSDEVVQWGLFRKGRQVLLLERETVVDKGPGSFTPGLRRRRTGPRMKNAHWRCMFWEPWEANPVAAADRRLEAQRSKGAAMVERNREQNVLERQMIRRPREVFTELRWIDYF